MKLDVNLSLLFTEQPMLARPEAAARAGFDAVELWWPFDQPVPPDSEIDELLTAIGNAGVQLVALNFDAGDMTAGDRGLVSIPSESGRFRANIDVAVGIAERAGCQVLNALYGNLVEGVTREEQDELAVENLARAAKAADRIGATVVVEALNAYENPRYPLTSTVHALEVIERVSFLAGAELALLYDAYHMQRGEGNLIATLRERIADIAHVQIADSPNRSEPGTGEIAYERVLAALDQTGYAGYVGLEYRPSRKTEDSLDWLPKWRRASRGAQVG